MAFGRLDPHQKKGVDNGVESDGELVGAGDFPEPFFPDSAIEHEGKSYNFV